MGENDRQKEEVQQDDSKSKLSMLIDKEKGERDTEMSSQEEHAENAHTIQEQEEKNGLSWLKENKSTYVFSIEKFENRVEEKTEEADDISMDSLVITGLNCDNDKDFLEQIEDDDREFEAKLKSIETGSKVDKLFAKFKKSKDDNNGASKDGNSASAKMFADK